MKINIKSIRHKLQDPHVVNAASSFSIHKYESILDFEQQNMALRIITYKIIYNFI
jgi:hypothetical protein